MEFLSDITLMEWVIMIVVIAIIGAAYWLIDDSRKRGMPVGGKACGGCPHYCQINRNCDGTPRDTEDGKVKKGADPTQCGTSAGIGVNCNDET